MTFVDRIKEAAIGGAAGLGVVFLVLGSRVRTLEDLDHLSTFSVGVLTIPLVALSYVLYKETRKTRLENSEPRVVVTIEPGRYFSFFEVIIENVGKGVAYDVQTTFSPDLTIDDDARDGLTLGSAEFLQPPILKPGQRFSQDVGRLTDITPLQSTVVCTSRGEDGREHRNENRIDLRMYERITQLGPDNYLHEIAKHLKELTAIGRKVTSGNRLEANVYDGSDRDEEEATRTQRRRAFRNRLNPQPGPPSDASRAGVDSGVGEVEKESPPAAPEGS